MKLTSLEQFYKEIDATLPEGVNKEIGHFNVFDIAALFERMKEKKIMPYNRRAYYKISLVKGRNRAEYADKIINIEKNALLFATPKIPYHWQPLDASQSGHFCVFTSDFLVKTKSGVVLDELPIFKASGYPVFQLPPEDEAEIEAVFKKMHREINSGYAFKYDLLRNYVLELIHYGQKLQPATALHSGHTASERVASLFLELLERQFPIETPQQQIELRSAKDFADRLSVHINHLNSVLKENTGKTTTYLISNRIIQEAKFLLKQTDWNISEIAYSLGFEEVAHFSNFFKRQTNYSPNNFRV
ncbi:helix-turn-helix domain-containing protein [Foetidibacter luteolus]|uniref:helix-turn-helix domain-containing protein n=1 Tax=Foetidibacter luteolus TaxID=2608880 RepID=UPI001F337669|nr:AraC family transcriptional regulator [Foetidibacter luteolus]